MVLAGTNGALQGLYSAADLKWSIRAGGGKFGQHVTLRGKAEE